MRQIEPDFEENGVDVRGTAFECIGYNEVKKNQKESWQRSIGGIGYNKYIGGRNDKRHPEKKRYLFYSTGRKFIRDSSFC